MELISKIFTAFIKNDDRKSLFENLKVQKSTIKLFSAIKNYSANSEIRYVGGCIRKILNGEDIDDIDFAVNLNPKECINCFKKNNIKYHETGIKHGTITAIIENNKFEITSLRKDLSTDGRHAKVEFSSDWYEDASRRDFTINSIYSDIDGNFYDPFNGKKDLQDGKIKFIGDPEKRIQEDYLRILRYIRFFLNYSKMSHDAKVKNIIKQNLNGLSKISSERLLDELKKIISSKGFLNLFEDNFSLEIIKLIFPEFINIDRLKNLNDLAKKKIIEKEVDFIFLIIFMVLDKKDNLDYLLFKFNFSNIDKKRILFLNDFYKQKINSNTFSEKSLWKIFYFHGKQSLFDLINFEILNSKKINKKLNNLFNFFQDKEVPIFPIKAKNLMEKFGISEGKLLGSKLRKIEEIWISNNFKVSEKEIFKVIKN